MIKIKRIYETPQDNDGLRILIDRLWPRGLTKEKAKIDKWIREIAPSDNLRRWFSHREERWEEFRKRYREELKSKKDLLNELKMLSKNSTVTLLYTAKNKARNNAEVLLGLLKGK